jgi:hypothetical protein
MNACRQPEKLQQFWMQGGSVIDEGAPKKQEKICYGGGFHRGALKPIDAYYRFFVEKQVFS